MIIGNKVNILQIFEEVLMVELRFIVLLQLYFKHYFCERVISKKVWLLWVGTGMNVLTYITYYC